MDYKKKYKDALAWVESIYPELNHEHQMEAEAFFPELKDSKYDEEIVKLADEYCDRVLIKECGMEEKEAHHCRMSYIHGAKAMLERQKWKPSKEQMIALRQAISGCSYDIEPLLELETKLKEF